MTRNWYAVYTMPQKEKKVSQLLRKKGIENFCPAIIATETKTHKRKEVQFPLFNSIVFVCLEDVEIKSLASIPWVINFLYWKSKPAVISVSEIDVLKKLSNSYSNIKLEKSLVDIGGTVKILDEPTINYNENTVSVKYNSIKVNLPSLGYTMTAERKQQKEEANYQQPGLLASFPKRINAFFFN